MIEVLFRINVLTVRVRQAPALAVQAVQAEVRGEAQLTLWRRLSAGRSHAALPPCESPRRAVTHAALPPFTSGDVRAPGPDVCKVPTAFARGGV